MKKIEINEEIGTGENLPPSKERAKETLGRALDYILEKDTKYKMIILIEEVGPNR